MFRALLVVFLLFTGTALQAATINSHECPDPKCCLPAPGPSSCHSEEMLCTAYCMHICPDGRQVKCAGRGGWVTVCRLSAPIPGEGACYILTRCDPGLYKYDPCSDPGCTDPAVLLDLCNKIIIGD